MQRVGNLGPRLAGLARPFKVYDISENRVVSLLALAVTSRVYVFHLLLVPASAADKQKVQLRESYTHRLTGGSFFDS